MSRLGVGLVVAIAACLVAPAERGWAVTVGATDSALVYTAEAGEANRASVDIAPDGSLRVFDSSDRVPSLEPAPVIAQPPCRLVRSPGPGGAALRLRTTGPPTARAAHSFPAIVDCPARPEVVATLAEESDAFSLAPEVDAALRLEAGPGDDIVLGGPRGDVLVGGPGRDGLGGWGGPDRLDGGPDVDTARYDLDQRRRSGVEVTLGAASAGSAEDGPAGARDRLVAIENVWGTTHADRLHGDAGANELLGGAGDDRLSAGRGADSLSGDPGTDTIDAGPGADRVDSRDEDGDRVVCDGARRGRGDDLLQADREDRVRRDCDAVAVAVSGAFDPPLAIARRASITAAGTVLLRVTCPLVDACRGRVRLRAAGGGRFGSRAFSVGARRTATVAVRSGRRARRRLAGPMVADATINAGRPGAQRLLRRLVAGRR